MAAQAADGDTATVESAGHLAAAAAYAPTPYPDILGPPGVVILDTDYILNQVAICAHSPFPAGVAIAPPFTRARAFASTHVLTELYQEDQLGNCDKWEKLAGQ